METRYVIVTGGVVSGLGKGITAASLGRLLKDRGLKVSVMKLDPYLNVDPGTMDPIPDLRQGLYDRHSKRTQGRLRRTNRADHSAYHR